MIRLDYLLKKDGYLFALMLITVPLAGTEILPPE